MRILDIEMQHFGKFVHRTIRFSDGLNVIYGRNETGKSTIHAFIRCMLLGMKPGEDGTENRYYDRYFPWQGNGQYDGTLRMAVGGKTYRIERSFLRQAPSLTVVCETDGVRYTDPEEKLQDLLDGLNEASFDNTIGIEQLKSSTQPEMLTQLERYVSNAGRTKNMHIDMDRAWERLTEREEALQKSITPPAEADFAGTQEALSDRQAECAQLRVRIYQQEKEQESLKAKIELTKREEQEDQLDYERSRDDCVREYEAARRNFENAPDPALRRKNLVTPLFVVLFLMCAGGTSYLYFVVGLTSQTILYTTAGLAAAAVLCFLGIIAGAALSSRNKKRYRAEDALRARLEAQLKESADRYENWKTRQPESRAAEIEQMENRVKELEQAISVDRTSLDADEKACEELSAALQTRRENASANAAAQAEIASVRLAKETLDKVSARVKETFGSRLCQEAALVLSDLTRGRYDRLRFEENRIYAGTDESMKEASQLSGGTIEQIYLAVRIAASRLLWQKTPMPFIFDDVFARYDDERLAAAMELLKKAGHQVIIFSCTSREDSLLETPAEKQ